MGVNNIFKFLRQNLIEFEAVTVIEENYELYIDLAIIIVPLMQRARSIAHFRELLIETFSSSSSDLVSLMLRADKVFVFLDMLSPRMKIETRVRRSLRQSINSTSFPVSTTCTNSEATCDCQGDSMGGCVQTHSVEVKEEREKSRYNVVKLRDVRSIMSNIIMQSMTTLDPTFSDRCYIETDVIGEGEIKCIRSAVYRSRECSEKNGERPVITVLSNDNDVIIMMLMHQKHIFLKLPPTLFYRVTFNELALESESQYKIEIQRVSVDRASCFRTMSVASRWRLLLWLICCCGTDFVPPIRPFSVNRRVYIFNACLRHGCRRRHIEEEFSMNSFLEELHWFVRLVRNVCSCSSRSVRSEVDRNGCSANIAKVAAWIIRLYWNILYVIDLPIDFYVEQRFVTDLSMYVNCYVPDEYISIFSLLYHLSDTRVQFLRQVIDNLLDIASETLRPR